MKPQDMLDLPQGTQVKLVKMKEGSEDYILQHIPLGTILTRDKHEFIDDLELCAFAHPDLHDGFEFFYAEELELV